MPISPGTSDGQPVFPARMEALAASVARGGRVYAHHCGQCHEASTVAPSVTAFPRVIDGRTESLETFLEPHRPDGRRLSWEGPAMADLIAYLISHLAGRPLGLQNQHATREGP